jgi:formylglycine-generating enzyme required for sulfatase activity
MQDGQVWLEVGVRSSDTYRAMEEVWKSAARIRDFDPVIGVIQRLAAQEGLDWNQMVEIVEPMSLYFVEKGPGKFKMGSTEQTDGSERYAHNEDLGDAEVTRPFELGATKWTQLLAVPLLGRDWFLARQRESFPSPYFGFAKVTDYNNGHLRPGNGPMDFAGDHFSQTQLQGLPRELNPNHPMERVSALDLEAALRERFNPAERKLAGEQNRPEQELILPREVQWEWAVRSEGALQGVDLQAARYFPEGLKELGLHAWFYENSGSPQHSHRVGTRAMSPSGFLDLHGNVWEWMADGYQQTPSRRDVDQLSTGSNRVLRGGSWFFNAQFCRSAGRSSDTPAYRYTYIGARLDRLRAH